MPEKYNLLLLNAHFESEDTAKDILLSAKNKSEFEQEQRRNFLDKRIEQRKNLYIYPCKANV